MKLFATFVAAAMAQADCPANSGWSYDATAGTCDPVGVTVTCSPTGKYLNCVGVKTII